MHTLRRGAEAGLQAPSSTPCRQCCQSTVSVLSDRGSAPHPANGVFLQCITQIPSRVQDLGMLRQVLLQQGMMRAEQAEHVRSFKRGRV